MHGYFRYEMHGMGRLNVETDRHLVLAGAEFREQKKREPRTSAGSPGDKVPSKNLKEGGSAET